MKCNGTCDLTMHSRTRGVCMGRRKHLARVISACVCVCMAVAVPMRGKVNTRIADSTGVRDVTVCEGGDMLQKVGQRVYPNTIHTHIYIHTQNHLYIHTHIYTHTKSLVHTHIHIYTRNHLYIHKLSVHLHPRPSHHESIPSTLEGAAPA